MFFIFVILFSFSCMTYKCDGYDISNHYAISFRKNDTILYVSSKNDTLRLPVIEFTAIGPIEGYGFFTTYECYPSALYKTSLIEGISIEENQHAVLSVLFCGNEEYALYAISNKVDGDYNSKCDNGRTVDGIEYETVWEVNDLSNKRRIDYFIKVSNYGILKFHDKQTDLVWSQVIR